MKTVILIVSLICLSLLLISTKVNASPYLACDPPGDNETVASGQVEVNGSWESPFDAPGCTDKQVGCVWTDANGVKNFILRDLSGVTDGTHTVRARFINAWGEGEISDPFVFTKSRPGKRAVRLIP